LFDITIDCLGTLEHGGGVCALVVQNCMAFFSHLNYRNLRKFFISTAQVKKRKKKKKKSQENAQMKRVLYMVPWE
jgi:UDP-2,3-diacylglucosamine pyrophosphatase LpxH